MFYHNTSRRMKAALHFHFLICNFQIMVWSQNNWRFRYNVQNIFLDQLGLPSSVFLFSMFPKTQSVEMNKWPIIWQIWQFRYLIELLQANRNTYLIPDRKEMMLKKRPKRKMGAQTMLMHLSYLYLSLWHVPKNHHWTKERKDAQETNHTLTEKRVPQHFSNWYLLLVHVSKNHHWSRQKNDAHAQETTQTHTEKRFQRSDTRHK